MSFWKRLLAFGFLSFPAWLPAQWAVHGDYGIPYSLLEARDGGWVIATTKNVLKLSPDGRADWGQELGIGLSDPDQGRAWSTPDDGVIFAKLNPEGGRTELIKLSSAGGVVWQKAYTLSGSTFNIFCPMADGGTVMAGGLDSRLLLCRCDADGEIAWQRTYRSDFGSGPYAVIETSDGGIFVLGWGTPAEAAPPEEELWVLKLTASGEIEWQKLIGGPAHDEGKYVFQTADGGYLLAGRSGSFNPEGRQPFWLLKLSSSGEVQRQLTFDGPFGGYSPGQISMQRADDGSFIAALAYAPGWPIAVVTIGEDGAIIRNRSYSTSIIYENKPVNVMPAQDGGSFLSISGHDSGLMKFLPTGEIAWLKTYGSDYSPDEIPLLGKTSTGGCLLAGSTSSWGGLQDALWVMATAADGSIGPNCYFVKDGNHWPVDEGSIQTEVAATVTDTAAVGQEANVVAQTVFIDLTAWGPTALPTLGKPSCTLTMGVAWGSGTITPPAGNHVYAAGTSVQIKVAPAVDYTFVEWTGNIYSRSSSLTIVMDGDKDIFAWFVYTGEGSEEKFGCFVATAAYGDPSHPDVEALRRFRDHYLMKSRAGRTFVELYYRYSPPLARFVAKRPVLRAISRAFLCPAVLLANVLNGVGPREPQREAPSR